MGRRRCTSRPTDVTNEDDIDAPIEATLDEFGSIDVLVNNAGVMLLGPVELANRQNFRQMVEVNLLGLMNLSHVVLPMMQDQDTGHIVNVSSTAGHKARPNSPATMPQSSVSTHSLKRSVRKFTTEGIRTTLIEPGVVETELPDHIPDKEVKEELEDDLFDRITPLQSEDIARGIAYAVTQPQYVSINELLIRPTDEQG